MKNALQLFTTIALAATLSFAQKQPQSYTFKTVLMPDDSIDGHVFDYDVILGAAINDVGEVAFICHSPTDFGDHIMTLHRDVAAAGEFVFPTIIKGPYSARYPIAIDNDGVVTYEALDADSDVAIFRERHLITKLGPEPSAFTLTEQGGIDVQTITSVCTQPYRSAKEKTDAKCAPLSMLPHNHRGQVVLALNTPQGPYLIVGTPTKH